jgi:hypothetical protein
VADTHTTYSQWRIFIISLYEYKANPCQMFPTEWIIYYNICRTLYNILVRNSNLGANVCAVLGEFAKFRKLTISFVMSVFYMPIHLSGHMEQLGSPLERFWWNFILNDFIENLSRKLKFH